jgi:hypothetical protein
MLGHVAGKFVSPLESAQRIIQDPAGGLSSLIAGGLVSTQKTSRQLLIDKLLRSAYSTEIRAAKAAGNAGLAQQIYEQEKRDPRM